MCEGRGREQGKERRKRRWGEQGREKGSYFTSPIERGKLGEMGQGRQQAGEVVNLQWEFSVGRWGAWPTEGAGAGSWQPVPGVS